MNFARDVVEAADPAGLALVELARDGSRTGWTFGAVADRSARLAGTLVERGVEPGDVVLTLIGNRPEWVEAMVACFRIGAVALPCTEQLRAKDLALRIDVARPKVILADERNRTELEAARPDCLVALIPDEPLYDGGVPPVIELTPEDPSLPKFPSGSAGDPTVLLYA